MAARLTVTNFIRIQETERNIETERWGHPSDILPPTRLHLLGVP